MAEKRLIDAKVYCMELYDEMNYPGRSEEFMAAIDVAIADLADAPTVDAVEVVRCRECKHHRDKNEQEQQYLVEDILICTSPDATDDCWNAVWPDHFCSYGERKEGTDNG